MRRIRASFLFKILTRNILQEMTIFCTTICFTVRVQVQGYEEEEGNIRDLGRWRQSVFIQDTKIQGEQHAFQIDESVLVPAERVFVVSI